MWEDPANIKGGKWILRLRKNKIDRAWESVSAHFNEKKTQMKMNLLFSLVVDVLSNAGRAIWSGRRNMRYRVVHSIPGRWTFCLESYRNRPDVHFTNS
jgi:hypothetical protein